MASPMKIRTSGGTWVDVASEAVDLSNYANMTTTPISGFRNAIINGDFRIWQRGTTFNAAANGSFSADRWAIFYDGSGATRNLTQQSFTAGNPITGQEPEYFLRYAQTVAGSGGTYNVFTQRVENVRTFAGQQITFSFWAKADTNRTIQIAGLQDFGSGGSSRVNFTINSTVNLTTSWQRFSATVNIPSISGKTIGTSSYLELSFEMPLNATFTIDIWGVQVEKGSTATPFEQRPIGTELALCQRYYSKSYAQNVSPGSSGVINGTAGGTVSSAYNVYIFCINTTFPVTMRTSPVISIWAPNGTANQVDIVGIGNINITAAERINDRCFANISLPSSSTGGFGVAFHWVASAEL